MGKIVKDGYDTKKVSIIRKFLETKEIGKLITWEEIKQGTGIEMDDNGKACVRYALRKHREEWWADPGIGLARGSPDIATDILGEKCMRIERTMKRGTEANMNLDRFKPSMNMENLRRYRIEEAHMSYLTSCMRR